MTPRAQAVLYAALYFIAPAMAFRTSADYRDPVVAADKNKQVYREYEKTTKMTRTNNDNEFLDNDNLDISNSSYKDFIRRWVPGTNGLEYRKRTKRADPDDPCNSFMFKSNSPKMTHPVDPSPVSKTYLRDADCETVIEAPSSKNVITLDFVDIFHVEEHPECIYDYLEIRDGKYGYSNLINRFCGQAFPAQITSQGPYLWMKFHSDDTIEYEGFVINIGFKESASSKGLEPSCFRNTTSYTGDIGTQDIAKCQEKSTDRPTDYLWHIDVGKNKNIYLNFSTFRLAKPNECKENFVEIFGSKTDMENKLQLYCGSMANSVTTKGENGSELYVRYYATKAGSGSVFNATYTAFRTLDTSKKNDSCDAALEFDCEDNTCIAKNLTCNNFGHCKLKTDEDVELCIKQTGSMLSQPHILIILVIFSLILSGMTFVFLFKCIRKLVQDHKAIKEHIRQSCEDRLDNLVGSKLMLDATRLQRESQPRASLERDNHTNEMYKKQRNFSLQKPSSIESDIIQETQIDLDEEPWRREVENVPIEPEEVRIERNGRVRKSDISRKEESLRRESKAIKGKAESETRDRKDIRDVSVGAPDTKESGCQTRESLFQPGTGASSDGTDSNSGPRGFSTFGYSESTIARPSPPAPALPPVSASQITIELLRSYPAQHETQIKKIPERRPMSTETTRSAPDVIIVSKAIR